MSENKFLIERSDQQQQLQPQQQQQQQQQHYHHLLHQQQQQPQLVDHSDPYGQNNYPPSTANPNYYPTPFYHRFVQSPAPFYLTGYTDTNGYIEIGAGGYPQESGPHLLPQGNDVMNFGYSGPETAGNGLVFDQMYPQQYAYGLGYLAAPQGYYDNAPNSYPIGYPAPFHEEALNGFNQQLRVPHHHGDLITPYSSELGSNDNLCGGSSSGGTGSASPTPKFNLTDQPATISSNEIYQSSAHVRPLDVITPELFQAIHAPTFYKTVVTPQQQSQPPQQAQPAAFYFPGNFGEAAVYNQSGPASMYIPPINSISSMAAAYQPMKSYQSPLVATANNNNLVQQPQPQPQAQLQQKQPLSALNLATRNNYTATKEVLPSVTGPDGQVYQKPAGSYASLITKALKECESGKMTLAGIYEWIKNNYPYYQSAEAAWQNSIRHNLSLNKCFKKVPRPADEPGKGGFWALDHEYIRNHELSKRLNNTQIPSSKQEQTDEIEDTVDKTKTPSDSKDSNPITKVSHKKRRTAELEASKLLEMLIPQEGWEDSVRAVASVVDEIYAANFEQEAINNRKQSEAAGQVKDAEVNTSLKNKRSRRSNIANLTNEPTSNITVSSSSSQRPREPKPYSSMSSTLKIPTPILPNVLSGPPSGTASASRQLQYHQYQPTTPLPSGTSSAK